MRRVPFAVVGELNPYGGDPVYALYHYPRGASGDRLRRHLGLRDVTYSRLNKYNLCDGTWDGQRAWVRAQELLQLYPVLVTLGRKVARAVRGGAETPFFQASAVPGGTVLALPHPSGLSRTWNEPGARKRARVLLQEHLPWVPWGEHEQLPGEELLRSA